MYEGNGTIVIGWNNENSCFFAWCRTNLAILRYTGAGNVQEMEVG